MKNKNNKMKTKRQKEVETNKIIESSHIFDNGYNLALTEVRSYLNSYGRTNLIPKDDLINFIRGLKNE